MDNKIIRRHLSDEDIRTLIREELQSPLMFQVALSAAHRAVNEYHAAVEAVETVVKSPWWKFWRKTS